jgi:hypothetical protein
MNAPLRRLLSLLIVVGSACAGGCYHIKSGGGPVTPPTGGGSFGPGTPTPTPNGTCQQLQGTTTQVIDLAADILPVKDPTYGNVWGSGLQQFSGGFPSFAAVIRLQPQNIVQFFNIDTVHEFSAVGLGTTGFPAVPHTFPSGTQNPVGTAISTGTWSTGRLGAASSGCYSQQFSLPQVITGQSLTIYFGDFDLYNFGFRNVLIVSTSAPQSQLRRGIIHLPR